MVGFESNVCSTVDPLGGSYAIEWLTKKLEGEILDLMEKINSKGGFLECFKNLWIEEQINESRNKMAEDIEKGDILKVGVNIFDEEKEEAKIDIDIFRHSPDVEKKRRQYLKEYRKNRDGRKIRDILDQLRNQMGNEPEKNCIPLVMEALEAKATLGEIMDTFRKAYDFEIRM